MATNYPGSLDTTSNLPDTIGDGSLMNNPDHATLHNTTSGAILALEAQNIGTVYNVKAYGATGNGSTDDTAAINAAIAASSPTGLVYFPNGTYKTSSVITITTGLHLQGQSKKNTIITNSSSHVFQTAAGNTHWFEVDHMVVQASGGHIFNIIANSNPNAFTVHDCSLQQSSNSSSIWSQTTSGSEMVEGYFYLNDFYVNGPATVPPFNMTDVTSEVSSNSNVFEKCVCTFGSASSVYFFNLVATSVAPLGFSNTFRDMVFEFCVGGAIFAQSQHQLLLESVQVWDNNPNNSTADFIHVGKASGGTNSHGVRIIDYMRSSSPLGAGLADISVDGGSQQVYIDSFRANSDTMTINLNSCPNCFVVGQSPGTTILNGSGSPSQFVGTGNPNSAAVWNARVGDVFLDQAATSGNTFWRCTVAGNPGTWVGI